ncbi:MULTISPECIES: hypothetical protein [Bacteria]|uniref:hypothetical protein n=1 Tax=Bacteria TaxID=2 RepID=UPI002E7AC77B|nr:hypothetical protein [Cetobacterium somerae]WVJ03167.1 hypothetical protein VSU16_14690 [Cetobacterium somerae]
MIINYSEEKYMELLVEHLNLLGYDTSNKSNIIDVIKCLAKVDKKNIDKKNKILNSLNFENRTGEELDEILNFFGLKRFKNYSDINKSCLIYNYGKIDILLKENTVIKYKNGKFLNSIEQKIKSGSENTIHFQVSNSTLSDNYDFLILGDFKIALNGIEVHEVNDLENKIKYLEENLGFLKFNDTETKESDIEFFNRASSVLQTYGDSNIRKIKNYIKGIEGVSDVVVNEEYDNIKVVIIPVNLVSLDKILDQSKEAVEYFATSHIEIIKPSVMEIEIDGIYSQLLEWFSNDKEIDLKKIISELEIQLTYYLKELYFSNNKKISRDVIEFIINKYFTDNKIQFSLNERKLNVNFFVFSSNDYEHPIVVGELLPRNSKELLADICIMRGVK